MNTFPLDGVSTPEGKASADSSPGLLDNLSLFAGLDGSKGPEDLGINANFGFRTGVNWGYPLLQEYGLGVQAGTAFNYGQNAVSFLQGVTGTQDRTQWFTTVGLFQRTGFGLNWGVGYDFLFEDYYQNIDLDQWRGQVGLNVTENDEIGVWGVVRGHGDAGAAGGQSFRLRAITQGYLFWRHVWSTEAVTRAWIGVAEEHGRFVLPAPGTPPLHDPIAFGSDAYMPLNDNWALFGEANFITPADSGTVTATFGVVFYPGGGARGTGRSRFAPMMPVANNPTFAVDLEQ